METKILKKGKAEERLFSAMQEAFYEGERSIFRIGEVEAAVVPLEDLPILKEIEE